MDIQKTALRLPKDLHQLVIETAQNSGHSMNAEIIARLRASFDVPQNDYVTREEVREIIREELNKPQHSDIEDIFK